MRFHNPSKIEQRFTVGPRTYVVPSGASVEIPDNLAYVVKARSMVLAEGPSPVDGAPVVGGAESLPDRVEVLLESPRLSPPQRADFRRTYLAASKVRRAQLVEELEAFAEGRGTPGVRRAAEDDDLVDGAPQGGSDDDAAGVDAQLDAAVTVVGKGRKARGG